MESNVGKTVALVIIAFIFPCISIWAVLDLRRIKKICSRFLTYNKEHSAIRSDDPQKHYKKRELLQKMGDEVKKI